MASNTSDKAKEEWTKSLSQYIQSGKDTITILTCGNMGGGKSSLVNGLIGEELAKEDMSPNPVTTVTQCYTVTVTPKECNPQKRSIKITVWDTPGFGANPETNPNVANDNAIIEEKAMEADLVLYCMDMRKRLPIEGVGIVQLTQICGYRVWENAIIALTFANEIQGKPSASREENAESFKQLSKKWKDAIVEFLKKENVPHAVVSAIPIIPVGYRETSPPDRVDWLSSFWKGAFQRTKARAQPSLLHANIERVQVKTEQKQPVDKPLEEQREAHQQSINLTNEFLVGRETSETIKVAGTAGVGGAVVGIGIGAAIGCLIGTAGGIFAPVTIPIAAGVGAFSGGAFGALSVGGLAGLIQRSTSR